MATGEAAPAEDRALLAQHPLIAERILAAAPALAPVARIVRSTYERYDGNGYPDGLAGQDIPLEARIIAAGRTFLELVDEHEGTSSDVLDELNGQAGVRLDPFVVDNLHELARDLGLTEMDREARRGALRHATRLRRGGYRAAGE
jgi:response regulator RpfG family c-di-GMP phosphodiesterase